MECNGCKFWRKVGRTNIDGEWTQSKSNGGKKLGWCRQAHPYRDEASDRGRWPETEYDDYCGEFDTEKTELETATKERWDNYFRWTAAVRDLKCEKRKLKRLIKAVKTKYPKIKLNDKALEKAVEIIERVEVK